MSPSESRSCTAGASIRTPMAVSRCEKHGSYRCMAPRIACWQSFGVSMIISLQCLVATNCPTSSDVSSRKEPGKECPLLSSIWRVSGSSHDLSAVTRSVCELAVCIVGYSHGPLAHQLALCHIDRKIGCVIDMNLVLSRAHHERG